MRFDSSKLFIICEKLYEIIFPILIIRYLSQKAESQS